MAFTDLFSDEEYEDVLRVMCRKFIEDACSCGSQSTRTVEHTPTCLYAVKANHYRVHADRRVAMFKLINRECNCGAKVESYEKHTDTCPWKSTYRHYQRYPLELEKDLTEMAKEAAGIKASAPTPATSKAPAK